MRSILNRSFLIDSPYPMWFLLAVISVALTTGCTADTFGEQACQTDEDCPSEHRCVSSGGVLFGESLCSPLTFSPEDADLGSNDMTDSGSSSFDMQSPGDMMIAGDMAQVDDMLLGCQENASAVGGVCQCNAGFEDDGSGACVEVDGCMDSPCYPGVECMDTPAPGDGFVCGDCPENSSGDGTTCACDPGFEDDGSGACADVDGCTNSNCFLGASCTDLPAPSLGFNCGGCPFGLVGDGVTCEGPSQIAAGYNHSCVIRADKTVGCWGHQTNGRLGGVPTEDASVMDVPGISDAEHISLGFAHNCAVLSTGEVRCWGGNEFGQLGDGTSIENSNPVLVASISNAVQVALGRDHSCALLSTGEVKCWGENRYGQLGDGTNSDRLTPVLVNDITGAVHLAAGENHTCALLPTGEVKCWGRNNGEQGLLGAGSLVSYSPTPLTVSNINTATALDLGAQHSCVLLLDGKVKCWGANSNGQLGNGTYADRRFAVDEVSDITNATEIKIGFYSSCALVQGGEVKCWGRNDHNQLGNDSAMSSQNVPINTINFEGAVRMALGGDHSCVITSDGRTKCWGGNRYGQLGVGSAGGEAADSYHPVTVGGYSEAVQVSLGGDEGCVRTIGGEIKCWGAGVLRPKQISGITNATDLAVGEDHRCILTSGGETRCWGENLHGQLGDGSSNPATDPVTVNGLQGVSRLYAGVSRSCALLQSGEIECWGRNDDGQLGDGTIDTSHVPVRVPTLSNVVQVALGEKHTCALISDGEVKCWGSNAYGQLGNDTTETQSTPTPVLGIQDAVFIAAGKEHSCAILTDSRAKCWGRNNNDQLGTGYTGDSLVPVPVNGILGAVELGLGDSHSCALLSNGQSRCWGDGNYGKLGGSGVTPVIVTGMHTATQLAVGDRHSCVLVPNTNVKCWGWGRDGQIGNGSTTNTTTPKRVHF